MSQVLLLDIGNTLNKAVALEDGQFTSVESFADDAGLICWLEVRPHFKRAIICAVKPLPDEIARWVRIHPQVLVLDYNTPLPFSSTYESPQTLGPDRIALAAAAFKRFPNKNVLVIDMGSCITYDFLDAQGVYRGGAISPGVLMRFKAMNSFTAKLPLVEPLAETELIGRNTEASLQSGVINGVQAEIDGIISRYEANYKDLTVLIGGGDNKYFDKRFKVNIFAGSNLVLEGLNAIV
ncbi:MAG: type III pantothenate kinase, partial [Bacteroidales bacterium]|nr:type III pantothenate kinase [Bacteroidales bacterium]